MKLGDCVVLLGLCSVAACGAATSKSSFDEGGSSGGAGSTGIAGSAGNAPNGGKSGASLGGSSAAGGNPEGGASAGGSTQGQGGAAGSAPAGMGGSETGGTSSAGGSAGAPTGGTTAAGGGGTSSGGSGSGSSAGAASAGKAGSGGVCAGVSTKTTPKTLPVDVIFVVDNSGSMSNEIDFIQKKLNAFSSAIVTAGTDMHVVLVSALRGCLFGPLMGCNPLFLQGMCLPAPLGSGNCPADANPPAYTHPNSFVDSNDGLNVIMKSFPTWKGALRVGAKKTMVILTDDDATVAPYDALSFGNGEVGAAAKFISDFTALDPTLLKDWKMAGIYAFSACSSAAAEGKVWREVVKQTGGLHGDLCKQDLQPILDDLQKAVVIGTQIPCQWSIPAPPPGLVFDPTQVNVVYTDGGNQQHQVGYVPNAAGCSPAKGGWYFDNDQTPTAVLACPSTCTTIQNDPMASVAVTFGCERVGLKN